MSGANNFAIFGIKTVLCILLDGESNAVVSIIMQVNYIYINIKVLTNK